MGKPAEFDPHLKDADSANGSQIGCFLGGADLRGYPRLNSVGGTTRKRITAYFKFPKQETQMNRTPEVL